MRVSVSSEGNMKRWDPETIHKTPVESIMLVVLVQSSLLREAFDIADARTCSTLTDASLPRCRRRSMPTTALLPRTKGEPAARSWANCSDVSASMALPVNACRGREYVFTQGRVEGGAGGTSLKGAQVAVSPEGSQLWRESRDDGMGRARVVRLVCSIDPTKRRRVSRERVASMRTSIFIAKRLARSAISSSTSLSGLSYESSENLGWTQHPTQQGEATPFRDVSRREQMRGAQVFTCVFGGVGTGT